MNIFEKTIPTPIPEQRTVENRTFEPTRDIFILSMHGSQTLQPFLNDILSRYKGLKSIYKNCKPLVNGSVKASQNSVDEIFGIVDDPEEQVSIFLFDDVSINDLKNVPTPERIIVVLDDCFELFSNREKLNIPVDEKTIALWKQGANLLLTGHLEQHICNVVNAGLFLNLNQSHEYTTPEKITEISTEYRNVVVEELNLPPVDEQTKQLIDSIDWETTPVPTIKLPTNSALYDYQTMQLQSSVFHYSPTPDDFVFDEEKVNERKLETALSQCRTYASRGEHHLGIAILTAMVPEEENRLKMAEILDHKIIALDLVNCAYLYASCGNLKEAVNHSIDAVYAIALEPTTNVLAWQACLYFLGQISTSEAEKNAKEMYVDSTADNPEFYGLAALNLVNVYIWQRRYFKAEEFATTALEKEPNNFSLLLARAFARFNQGVHKYAEAYDDYNHRLDAFARGRNTLNCLNPDKLYDPNSEDRTRTKLDFKQIMIFGEQGVGDSIQYSRYINRFCNENPNARFVICVPKPLQRLFQESMDFPENVMGVVTKEDLICRQLGLTSAPETTTAVDLLSYDLFVPLLSLPSLLGIENNPLSELVPYIKPERAYNPSDYREFMTPRIGICHRGNLFHSKDYERSLNSDQAKQIIESVPAADFLNLNPEQYLEGTTPLPENPDFQTTAEIMETLDLVVTVDSAVAHLAGSMKIPTIVLIPYRHDWRWSPNLTEDENNTIWYSDELMLLRQSENRDWQPVIDRLCAFLQGWHYEKFIRLTTTEPVTEPEPTI